MTNVESLHQDILERLSRVIDPETGVDVVRMRLIEEMTVNGDGHVTYTFRPSSPLCPIAVPLANAIQLAVSEVPGVTSQDVKIVDFAMMDELNTWLKQALEDWQREQGK
jgi:metal-sulfur cluster biosynthetic enzyme